jgi:VWFA-related protein
MLRRTFLATTAVAACAQDAGDVVIRGGVEMVNLMVTVRGRKGAYVAGLAASDFKILEDGKLQEIRDFSPETNLPLTLAVMVDASDSMAAYFPDEQRAGAAFLERVLRPKDRALVAAFRLQTELLQDTTSDLGQLRSGLSKLKQPVQPQVGTVLYDALELVARARLRGQPGRKVVVLLTDGADYGSKNSLTAAREAMESAEAMVYAILYPYSGPTAIDMGRQSANETSQPDRAMEILTENTGGRVFKVSGGKGLEKVFDQIQEEIRSQYSVSYVSTNDKRDGKFRKVEVKMANKDHQAQTRRGYVGPR